MQLFSVFSSTVNSKFLPFFMSTCLSNCMSVVFHEDSDSLVEHTEYFTDLRRWQIFPQLRVRGKRIKIQQTSNESVDLNPINESNESEVNFDWMHAFSEKKSMIDDSNENRNDLYVRNCMTAKSDITNRPSSIAVNQVSLEYNACKHVNLSLPHEETLQMQGERIQMY